MALTVVKKPGPPGKPAAPAPKPPAAAAPAAPTAPAKPKPAAGVLTSKQVQAIVDKANKNKEALADPVQDVVDEMAAADAEVDQSLQEYEPPAGEVEETTLEGAPAQGNITITHKQAGKVVSDTSTTEQVGEAQSHGRPMANVGYSMGVTKNLGDFNMVKVQVSIHLPCEVDADDIEVTYAQAKEWVDDKLNTTIAEIDASQEG